MADSPPVTSIRKPGPPADAGGRGRLLAVGGVAALHGAVYLAVTRLTLLRPAGAFMDPRTPLDNRIPHLPWLWPLYWLPYLLVPVAGALLIRRMETAPLRRLVLTWSAMIVVGGAIQVLIPARAPWPPDAAAAQQAFHDSPLILPFATLPSMHVAHVALGAGVAASTAGTPFAWAVAAVATFLVAFTTLALKEHLALDALAGLALAGLAYWWWRRGVYSS